MKNIFRFLMAAVIFFGAVSCAKEDISSSLAGGEVEVTFTANLPELGTRAYADGANANLLRCWVYDAANGNLLKDLSKEEGVPGSGTFTFTLSLIKGMTYNFVLWADQNVGTLENPKGLYDVTDGIVTVDYTENKVKANDNNRDAFYGYVANFKPETSNTHFTLTRPFAQINAATSEKMEDITDNGLTLATSSIKTKAYTQFNITTGDVVDNSLVDVELAATTMPYLTKDAEGNPAPNKLPGKETYTYLAMGYILAPQDGMVSDVTFCFNGKKGGADFTVGGDKGLSYGNVPLKQNYRTNILGQLLTKSTEIEVEIKPGFGGDDQDYEVVEVATAGELQNAIANNVNAEVVLTQNIELSAPINITSTSRASTRNEEEAEATPTRHIVIDGNGATLTYTGSDRAIDVKSEAAGANVTIKNLTINCTASYCQRGINYNTNGTLVLEKVTVKGKNVTYALNCPGYADNAKVEIIDSEFTGNIALNLWGANMRVNAKNSIFTSVDNSAAEGYAAIVLNDDGAGNSANGTVVDIVGGEISALDENGNLAEAISNSTTGVVNVSDSTEVTGVIAQNVAIILGSENATEFYSTTTLAGALETSKDKNMPIVRLIADVEVNEILTITHSCTLDLNGKTLTGTANRLIRVSENEGQVVNVTIKNGTIVNEAEKGRCVETRSGNVNLTLEGVTLIASHQTNNNQVFTVGGNGDNINVTIKNSNLNAGKTGYGIVTFNPVTMTIEKSTINGYGALYAKAADSSLGSAGSVFHIKGSTIISTNDVAAHESNSFSTVIFEDNNVTINVDAASSLKALTNNNEQSIFGLGSSIIETVISGSKINVAAGAKLEGTILGLGSNQGAIGDNTILLPAEYADQLSNYEVSEADNGQVKVEDPSTKVANAAELAAAIAQGGIVVLTQDIELSAEVVEGTSAALAVAGQDIIIDLNGKTLKAGKSDKQRLLYIGTGANVTIENGNLEIISTNGMVDGTNASTGGSSVIYCNGGNISMSDVEIIGSQRGGHRAIEVHNGVGVFNNVKIDVNYGLGINAGAGANVTIDDCNITVTGMYSAPYNSTCFSVMGGGEMVVNSGNYKLINNNTYSTGDTHGGWVGIIMNSGGSLTLNGGTFTNIPAQGFMPQYERPLFSCDATAGNTATLNFMGGTYAPQEDQIAHKGGSGGTEIVKIKGETIPGYSVNTTLLEKMTNNGNGTWTVQ